MQTIYAVLHTRMLLRMSQLVYNNIYKPQTDLLVLHLERASHGSSSFITSIRSYRLSAWVREILARSLPPSLKTCDPSVQKYPTVVWLLFYFLNVGLGLCSPAFDQGTAFGRGRAWKDLGWCNRSCIRDHPSWKYNFRLVLYSNINLHLSHIGLVG